MISLWLFSFFLSFSVSLKYVSVLLSLLLVGVCVCVVREIKWYYATTRPTSRRDSLTMNGSPQHCERKRYVCTPHFVKRRHSKEHHTKREVAFAIRRQVLVKMIAEKTTRWSAIQDSPLIRRIGVSRALSSSLCVPSPSILLFCGSFALFRVGSEGSCVRGRGRGRVCVCSQNHTTPVH
ncbi:hypothetical protein ABB37_06779 [Leptomonas pyrrhocoris]|uniref:Uncharacterized protein n=1 Tax=Leptomonas pyrrhocoris TaxID=157538 RepID=A0A0M9FXM1_LEPPY|nr:hypothetical protein ABB37_06779 [Leptomonas pyrrhocoris]XP_015656468.1 hypothetical protein ABB37_06779 [Leptomonas pyrrhocoris]XP_015656469.1 hypothetical protein ABB37_06779 [Leptomonas pyrrhocoris]KPA78028.1 hypothetical protein ABB37_06779 [Leptomonas pyrrhocoris]KPA78029.1 hypothetical protein ABB37_06779 [Leptomonas pyrrhocoris]KPA78030.1 hypothetical protein ABB37_06779 [Leptomonas pyrrhocoris]|eukprot:XP_015656467.1 hypothetical protein ABB37_06779 [Leptomonas pyrrhocoris]